MKKTLSIILSIVILISTIMGANLSVFAADAVECKDTLSNNNEWYTGYITDDNTVDYYKIVVPSDGVLTMKYMHYMGIGLDVYDVDLSYKIDDEWFRGGSTSSPVTDTGEYCLSKGTYYVRIIRYDGCNGIYKISKNFTPFGNNETEPNDFETAMNLTAGKVVTGALTFQDDVDWYKLNIISNMQITIKLTHYMGVGYDVFNDDLSNRLDDKWFRGGSTSSPATDTGTYYLSKGTYYVRIIKYDGSKGKYNISWNFNVSVGTPANLKVLSRNTTSLKLSWSKVSGANGYELQRKSGNTYVNSVTTTATTATVSKLTSATNYSFRVRAYKIFNGKKYYSGWKTLTTPTTPSKVSIKAPSTNKKHEIVVKWNKVARATGYQVQYCKDSKCSKIIATKTVSGQSKTSYTGKNFTKNKKYYVRVRAYKTVNGTKYYGAWSAVKSIKCK